MHFNVVFDQLYVLGSLWAALTAPPVCPASLSPPPETVAAARPLSPNVSPEVTAFVDVNVVPMDTERVLSHQTVVVQDGRITRVGPANAVPVPEGAVRVDGRGQ